MKRGYSCIGLELPKFNSNVGGAIRAAGVFEADLIVVSGSRFKEEATDTQKAFRHIPLIKNVSSVLDVLPHDCIPVAVEITKRSKSIYNYVHPERAFYVFGAEDHTLDDSILNKCRDVISIPSAHCLNLAAAVNVVLYDRRLKREAGEVERT